MALNVNALASIVLTFVQNSYMLFLFIDFKWLSSPLMCHWVEGLPGETRYVNYEIFALKFEHSLSSIDISTGMGF